MREVPCMLSDDLVVWNGGDSMFNFSLPFEVPKMTRVDFILSLGIILLYPVVLPTCVFSLILETSCSVKITFTYDQ